MLLKRVLSGILVVAFAVQASGVHAAPRDEIQLNVPVKKSWVRNACEWTLSGYTTYVPEKVQKAITKGAGFMGWLSGVTPVWRTLTNKDRRWFVLAESPSMGVIIAPVSTFVAYLVKGGLSALFGPGWDAVWSKVSLERALAESWQAFVSYELGNIPRNAVNTASEKEISSRLKVLLNWFYSATIYSFFTASGLFYSAQTPEQFIYAYSMVAYSMAWPVLSQFIATHVTVPYLFNAFPKKDLLERLRDPQRLTADLLRKEELAIAHAEELLADPTVVGDLRKDAENARKEARSNISWVKWYRDGVPDGQAPGAGKRWKTVGLKLWGRMKIALPMIVVYFLVRWWLVGPDAEHPGHLTHFLEFLGQSLGVESWGVTPAELMQFERGLSTELSQTLPKVE